MRIELNQHVSLTFSLKYLVNFAKSSSLSTVVQLMMSNDVPLLVSNFLYFVPGGCERDPWRTHLCFAGLPLRFSCRLALLTMFPSRSPTSSAKATFATTSLPRSATTSGLPLQKLIRGTQQMEFPEIFRCPVTASRCLVSCPIVVRSRSAPSMC